MVNLIELSFIIFGAKTFVFIKYNFWYILLLIIMLILSCLYIEQRYELIDKTNELIKLKQLLLEDYEQTLR